MATTTRRAFLGTATAGVIAAGVGVADVVAAGRASGQQQAAQGKDEMLAFIAAEIARIHRAAKKKNQWRSEHSRALAANMRLFAVHGKTIDLDRRIRANIGNLGVPDHARMRSELAALGMDANDGPMPSPDPGALAALVADLSAGRVTWTQMALQHAAQLEEHASRQEQREGAVNRDAHLQPVVYQDLCFVICGNIAGMELWAAIACSFGMVFPGPEMCAIALGAWFAMRFMNWMADSPCNC